MRLGFIPAPWECGRCGCLVRTPPFPHDGYAWCRCDAWFWETLRSITAAYVTGPTTVKSVDPAVQAALDDFLE